MSKKNNLVSYVRADPEDAERQINDQQKRIDYYITEYSVELLAEKMKEDLYIPNYQREYTWDETRKSRFIESIIMGLPVPFLFFWENPTTGKLEIVDGSQRLRTIQEFLNGKLRLTSLDKLTKLQGFTFPDLPLSRQRKIRNRSIRGIILNEKADEFARLDLFDRINTGSKVANKAEIRRGVLMGPFMDLLVTLSKDDLFVELAPVTQKQLKEREREELVTRFFAYSDGLDDYSDNVSEFLFNYTKKMNERFQSFPEEAETYKDRFFKTLRFIRQVFPYGFKKLESGTVSPRARFESIAIGTYEALRVKEDINPMQSNVIEWLDSVDFKNVTGADGANAKRRLENRINFVKNKLLKV